LKGHFRSSLNSLFADDVCHDSWPGIAWSVVPLSPPPPHHHAVGGPTTVGFADGPVVVVVPTPHARSPFSADPEPVSFDELVSGSEPNPAVGILKDRDRFAVIAGHELQEASPHSDPPHSGQLY